MFSLLRKIGLPVAVLGSFALLLAGCGSGGLAPVSGVTVSFSTASLTFAGTGVGTSAAPQTITVTPVGGSVTFSGLAITGSGASSFAVTSTCQGTVGVGQTCSITVTATPTAVGAVAATLMVTDNAENSPQSIALNATGQALAPIAVFSATSIDFGGVAVNAAAVSKSITITNAGNAPILLSALTLTPATGTPFTLGGTCVAGVSIAPASSCTLTATYAAKAIGAAMATVSIATNAPGSPQAITLTGTAYSGLTFNAVVKLNGQPVVGATVQLYQAGATGNGSAATALLASTLTTDTTGTVIVPGRYSCDSAAQLYLVSTGGTAAGASAANSALTLADAIGACNGIVPGMQATLDEATTVAVAFALAPFYSSPTAIGASATNATGLANAFLSAAELADPAAGTVPGKTLPSTVTLPAPRVNSLANLVSACTSASACSAFLAAAGLTPGKTGVAAPANTLDALAAVAHQPGANVAALYTASLTRQTYLPALTSAPADWTLALTLTGGGMNTPTTLAVDSTGSVWVANYFFVASKFTTTGAPVFPTGITGNGLNNSYGLAIDLKDNVWIANQQPLTAPGNIGTVTELTAGGTSLSGTGGFKAGGLNYPSSIAIDPNGTNWVVDYGNSHVTLLNAAGAPLSGTSGYTTPLFAFPVVVAVDDAHAGWIGNQADTGVVKLAADGATVTRFDCCNGASGLAIDQGNNVWVANFFGDSVSLIRQNGTIASTGYTAGGTVVRPQGIAIDGAGSVWVANFRAAYLTELSGVAAATPGAVLSPAPGYAGDAGIVTAYALAIDASGNLWISNTGINTVTKLIGLAVPVRTPLSGSTKAP